MSDHKHNLQEAFPKFTKADAVGRRTQAVWIEAVSQKPCLQFLNMITWMDIMFHAKYLLLMSDGEKRGSISFHKFYFTLWLHIAAMKA